MKKLRCKMKQTKKIINVYIEFFKGDNFEMEIPIKSYKYLESKFVIKIYSGEEIFIFPIRNIASIIISKTNGDI